MKIIDLKKEVLQASTPEAISLIQSLEQKRGLLYSLPEKKKLNRLHDLSKRRSVTSSNKIEGIGVSPKREKELFSEGASPESKEDYMLLGYNNALQYVLNNYKFANFSEELIKDLHYKMYKDFSPDFGGKYKDTQNYINQYDEKGRLVRTVFIPPDIEDTPQLMGNLVYQFLEAVKDPLVNRLILIFDFILNFCCIHPFNDGNGRVSRLLTTFLLLKFGYTLDLYYSTSYVILHNLTRYYASLEESDQNWNENENDPAPFVIYMLSTINEGYSRLAYIQELADDKGLAIDKVLRVIKDRNVPTSKEEIEEILFQLSRTTIELAIHNLLVQGEIIAIAKGRYAKYVLKPNL